MLLFLPEGVLSVTAHKKETFNLKVRALDPAVIEKHLSCTVYCDGRAKMPYHGTIMRPQLQELMFTLLEQMSYSELPTEGNGKPYGILLNQVNQVMGFYLDSGIDREKYKEEPTHEVPEVAEYLAEMVMGWGAASEGLVNKDSG
ncbi:hypothetical protein [Endozoicomonas sp.]|uniref:hypothetical protein n=1 Tax=Endozoicomonas sp. TaxID=1892382 RepID=UPI00383BDCC9